MVRQHSLFPKSPTLTTAEDPLMLERKMLLGLMSSHLAIVRMRRKAAYQYVLRHTAFKEGKGRQDRFGYDLWKIRTPSKLVRRHRSEIMVHPFKDHA